MMTKEIRSRGWIITQSKEKMSREELEAALAKYPWIGQEELGEGGFEHFQVYVEAENPIKFSTLKKKLPTAHLEVRQGSRQQAFDYCTKEDTRVGNPFGTGGIDLTDEKGKRSDLEFFHSLIMEGAKPADIYLEHPRSCRYVQYLDRLYMEKQGKEFSTKQREVEVVYVHGPTGSGKTRAIYDEFGYEDVFRVTNYEHPFDQYVNQDVLVFDEFHSQIQFTAMLNYLDRYPVQLKARYNDKWACFTRVFIISNISLEEQYPNIKVNSPESYAALIRRIQTVKYVGYETPENVGEAS